MNKIPKQPGTVYLLHFDRAHPLAPHEQHYIGFTSLPLQERVERHKSGNGAKLVACMQALSIGFQVVRVWENVPYAFERKLKNCHNHKRFCPICNPKAAHHPRLGKVAIASPNISSLQSGNSKAQNNDGVQPALQSDLLM
jgi:predicted GIY-YIG superfamily endonuclease